MFKPLPMLRVELSLLKEDASQAALLLANYGSFAPEISEVTHEQFPELPGEAYRQAYIASRAHLDKILLHYEINSEIVVSERADVPMQAVGSQQLEEIGSWLKTVWGTCSEQQERMCSLRDEYRRTTQLLGALDQFKDISIDLTLLQKKSSLLDVRVGTLPRANIQRFEEALGLAGYVALRFFTSEEQVHLIIAGATGKAQEVERVLQAAGWRTMEIPAEFHGRPKEVRQELCTRLTQLTQQMGQEDVCRRAQPEQDRLLETLLTASGILTRAAPYAALVGLMRGCGSLVTVSGWIPDNRLPQLKNMLMLSFGNRYALQARVPRADERLRVPSVLRHHRWLQPFAGLVLNYGVPRYGEIDPTVLFAISFVLMFGMMFGDVGQGVLIALTGGLLRRRLGLYAIPAMAVGISSSVFGMLYGSVFGYENVFPTLWISPLSDPMRMLGVALGWGVVFILLAALLNIRNRIAEGHLRDALLHSQGAAGLLLYLGLLFGFWNFTTVGQFGWLPLLAISAASAAIFAHSWQHSRGNASGERLLTALMEAYEAIMADISNTLSFLRLAAFSLNHVALSFALFILADRLHSGGYWVTVALGNLLILVVEGAIVVIQTLRLEYYEGFSRFFGGDGRTFRPLTLENKLCLVSSR